MNTDFRHGFLFLYVILDINHRYDALETHCVAIAEKQKQIKEKLPDKLFEKES